MNSIEGTTATGMQLAEAIIAMVPRIQATKYRQKSAWLLYSREDPPLKQAAIREPAGGTHRTATANTKQNPAIA